MLDTKPALAPAEANTKSKILLLAYIDIMLLAAYDEFDHETRTAIIMNRNRVAKFLGQPTRKFDDVKRSSTTCEA